MRWGLSLQAFYMYFCFTFDILMHINHMMKKRTGGHRMANQEHVDILKHGVEMWNQWREENDDIQPDLTEANLS